MLHSIGARDHEFAEDAKKSVSDPLLVVILADSLNGDISQYSNDVLSLHNESMVYVLSADGTFGDPVSLWDSNHPIRARVIHCNPLLCDSLVLSVSAYEVYQHVAVVLWSRMESCDPKESLELKTKSLSMLREFRASNPPSEAALRTSRGEPVFSIYTAKSLRAIASSPCYRVEYSHFNPISRFASFSRDCSVKRTTIRAGGINNRTAVVLTLFKRNYLHSVLTHLCSQTLLPEMILFVQNMKNVTLRKEMIPVSCNARRVKFYHIWLSNWNSYSFMRHYVPIPTDIHNTVLIDDDMFLKSNTLETGVSTMHAHHCIATERGRRIDDNPEGHPNWPFVLSKDAANLTVVDYSFIPFFEDTEWRKSVYKTQPFSRVYGDILFVSLAIYQDIRVPSCVIPRFEFFERNEDNDSFSTSKKNRVLYNQYYNGIAAEWIARGYKPVAKRLITCHCLFHQIILIVIQYN